MIHTAEEIDLDLKGMEQFHGTQGYHSIWLGALATDGVAYIMANGYSWLVTDAVSIIKTHADVAGERFLLIKLELRDNSECDMIIEDGNDRELYRQHYAYTNAKKSLKLYFINNVMLLPNEY